jgi:hypothetical protein
MCDMRLKYKKFKEFRPKFDSSGARGMLLNESLTGGLGGFWTKFYP